MLTQPPYALAQVLFRFRALAALAGRLPLGGEREAAMALFIAVRLTESCTLPAPLDIVARKGRLAGARHWLAAMTIPPATRAAVLQLADATVGVDGDALVVAFDRLVTITTPLLDAPSRAELKQLGSALRSLSPS